MRCYFSLAVLVVSLIVSQLLPTSFSAGLCFDFSGSSVVSGSRIEASLYLGDVSQFRLVNVTLIVRDSNGLPIKGAQVKAFSEDYGFRIPNFLFSETDEYGRLTLSLPVGVWSFFAWGGWDYINRNSGQGYFVVLKNVSIISDVSLTLQPDSYISIRYLGLDGRSLDGEVRILDSDHGWKSCCQI